MLLIVLMVVLILQMVYIFMLRYTVKKNSYNSDKNMEMVGIFNFWLYNINRNKRIFDYLNDKNISRVVIYGMGCMGIRLYEELQMGNIEVVYAVDKNPKLRVSGLEVRDSVKCGEDVDAVIVTPTYHYEAIEEEWKNRFNCQLISLADIIYRM